MKLDKEFKYKTKFTSQATYNFGKWKEARANKQVFASLDNLRSLLPDDATIEDDSDLLYTSFNAAVVNLINANGHGIGTETALAISKYFVKRHMNVEHDRWNVIGHIISQGFSSFGENKMLTAKELDGTNEPFNICLGAIVYKIVREYMAEIIQESCDKESDYHQCISASWEIGFNEYDIVLGSKKISDAEIISDPEKVAEYSQYLEMEGGEGFLPDGTPVYCLIKGDARPLGCAFTSSPAAAVTGLFVPNTKDMEEDPENDCSKKKCNSSATITEEEIQLRIHKAVSEALQNAENEKKQQLLSISSENKENNNKNNSHNNKKTVNKNMKLKTTEDITPEFLKEAEASEVRDFIKLELDKLSADFNEKLKASNEDKVTAESSLSEAEQKFKDLEEKFQKLQNEVEAKKKEDAFKARLEEVTETYELNEAQLKAITSKLENFDDASYSDWKSNEAELFLSKKGEKKQSETPSPETGATAALKTAEASKKTLIPNSTAPEADEFESMVESLKDVYSVQ